MAVARQALIEVQGLVAGVDEAGRGPLAGPVVAAAVILPEGGLPEGLDDSKRLSPSVRERLAAWIKAEAVAWSVGIVEPAEIDAMNIHHAALEAMRRAVVSLRPGPQKLLVDGRFPVPVGIQQEPVVGGDRTYGCIAAASVLAKVTRDEIMLKLHERWPQYNFASNKGYPTPEHTRALRRYGPCPAHRRSFAPVAQLEFEWQP